MPTPTSIDAWLDGGHQTTELLVHHDVYFADDEPTTPTLGHIFDRLLNELDEDQRIAVNLVVIGGLSYRQAALEMGLHCGPADRPNKKQAWRLVRYGLRHLRRALEGDEWVQALAGHRIPDPEEQP